MNMEITSLFQFARERYSQFHLNWEVKSEETHSVRDASRILRKRVTSRETRMAERIACKSNNNSDSRCSIHW